MLKWLSLKKPFIAFENFTGYYINILTVNTKSSADKELKGLFTQLRNFFMEYRWPLKIFVTPLPFYVVEKSQPKKHNSFLNLIYIQTVILKKLPPPPPPKKKKNKKTQLSNNENGMSENSPNKKFRYCLSQYSQKSLWRTVTPIILQ